MPAPIPDVVANWFLVTPLGSGVSGSTFEAVHIHNGQHVALKVQDVDIEYPTNAREREVYMKIQGGKGMPMLWAHGVEGKNDYLALDLLGSSLDGIYKKQSRLLDLRTTVCLAIQLLERLEWMHSKGVLHRDIQLGNICLGREPNEKTFYMIDFGFSKFYIDPKTKKHIPDTPPPCFIGNYWFSSANVHSRGKAHSRRDDLEATALLLIHVLTPNGLPWTRNGLPKDDKAHNRIKHQKRTIRPGELCAGLPEQFEEFLRYCRRIGFTEQPDYEMWRGKFRELARERGFVDIENYVEPLPPVLGGAQTWLSPGYAALLQRAPAPNLAPNQYLAAPAAAPAPVVPHTPRGPPPRLPAVDNRMENVLRDLARLDLNDVNTPRPPLGDKKNVHQSPAKNTLPLPAGFPIPVKKPSPPAYGQQDLSDDSDDRNGGRSGRGSIDALNRRWGKASRLNQLVREANGASNNKALSKLVTDFVKLLKDTSSRTLTKEAFAFLDVLHKQLSDPSVFIVPLRQTKRRTRPKMSTATLASEATDSGGDGISGTGTGLGLGAVGSTLREQRSKLWQLRSGVRSADDNTELGRMVAEFGTLVDQNTNKTLTKDGYAFLEGIAERLSAIEG